MAVACQAQTVAELSSATHQSRFTRSRIPVQSAEPRCRQFHRCRHAPVSKHIQAPFRSSTHRSHGLADRSRSCRAKASSGGDGPQDSPQIAMSPQEAYDLLGVKEGASFEQIMSAKNRLVSKAGNDQGLKTQVQIWIELAQHVSVPQSSATSHLFVPCS